MMHEILIEALGYKESRICKEEERNDFEMYESARCMVTSKLASTRRERATRPGLLSSCEGRSKSDKNQTSRCSCRGFVRLHSEENKERKVAVLHLG
jgi:hypothetical protein